VTETHNFALIRERGIQPSFHFVCGADFVEGVHDCLVCATVQQALQRTPSSQHVEPPPEF